MTQNTSFAVMAQRRSAPDDLDFFPTPPWATRALVEHVLIGHINTPGYIAGASCWDPACGHGDMVRPLKEYFASVRASDIFDYGAGAVQDFLATDYQPDAVDYIITNPPFARAGEFVLKARAIARSVVAVLVRTAFLEGKSRYFTLYRDCPPMVVAPFVERVPMVKGRLDRHASSATSYTWLVWPGSQRNTSGQTKMVWIPPCRKKLERDDDYAVVMP